MTERSVTHATIVIERSFEAEAGRVFRAWADAGAKAAWFGGPPGVWKELDRQLDFRVGGRELLLGSFLESGMTSKYVSTYHEIVPDKRIVLAYDMYTNDKLLSVSLTTVELSADGKRTQLKYTEQGAFFDGLDGAGSREQGTRTLFDRLASSLAR